MKHKILLSFFVLAIITSECVLNTALAAFPNDFESGVLLIEETASDGDKRRANGFNDGGINGNVPNLRKFLNEAQVDNTLIIKQGRLDPLHGRELDFIHDERCNWPNGPENDNLNIVNGVVFMFHKIPDSDIWAGGTFEYIKPCRTDRSLAATYDNPSRRFKFEPLNTFQKPKEGQVLGFMVSGITRGGIIGRNNIKARTNVAFFRVGEESGNGVMLTDNEVKELFDQPQETEVDITPPINLLLED